MLNIDFLSLKVHTSDIHFVYTKYGRTVVSNTTLLYFINMLHETIVFLINV